MTTLTLTDWSVTQWLLTGNLFFLLLLVGVMLQQRVRQKNDLAELRQTIAVLEQGHEAMSQSTIGIGRRIKQLEKQPVAAPRTMSETDEMRFAQASRLVGMGASASDLVENLGVARAEADLLVSLKGRATA